MFFCCTINNFNGEASGRFKTGLQHRVDIYIGQQTKEQR